MAVATQNGTNQFGRQFWQFLRKLSMYHQKSYFQVATLEKHKTMSTQKSIHWDTGVAQSVEHIIHDLWDKGWSPM